MSTRLFLVSVLALGCTHTPSEPDASADDKASETGDHPADSPRLDSIPNFIYTPLVTQATDYTCGVAALQSVLHYYGAPDQHESTLAERLGSDPDSGTNFRSIVSYARSLGFHVAARTDMTIADLVMHIDAKRPVLIALQAWAADPEIDWRETYENGHYAVATGYDARNIYFMDSYLRGAYSFIPRDQLEDRWHDIDSEGPLEHFGIVISGKPPAFDFQRVVAMP